MRPAADKSSSNRNHVIYIVELFFFILVRSSSWELHLVSIERNELFSYLSLKSVSCVAILKKTKVWWVMMALQTMFQFAEVAPCSDRKLGSHYVSCRTVECLIVAAYIVI